MKKSRIVSALVLASTFLLTGCGEEPTKPCVHVDDNKDHYCDLCEVEMTQHVAGEEYGSDQNSHWHECTYDGCDEKLDVEDHIFGPVYTVTPATCEEDGVGKKECLACGKEVEVALKATGHSQSASFVANDQYHWHTCLHEGCDEVLGKEAHTFGEATVLAPATCTSNGLAMKKCSVCGHTVYETLAKTGHNASTEWSYDENYHWHACLNEGCHEHLNEEKHEFEWLNDEDSHWYGCACVDPEDVPASEKDDHVDNDGDFYCDVCDRELPGVEKVELDYITGYIGAGESVTLTAKVTAHCGVSEDVEWHLEKSNGSSWKNSKYTSWDVTDVFTLVDNEDGTATLSGVMKEYTAEFSCYVYATSKYDNNVSSNKTEKIFYQTWNNTKRGTINGFFGAGNWQMIPFFPSCTVQNYGDTFYGYSTARSSRQMINSFENSKDWKKLLDWGIDYDVALYYRETAGQAYLANISDASFTIYKIDIATSFPASAVAEFIEDVVYSEGTIPAFEGGNKYILVEDLGFYMTGLVVVVDDANAAMDSYKQTLTNNGWSLFTTADDGSEYFRHGTDKLIVGVYVVDGALVIEMYGTW